MNINTNTKIISDTTKITFFLNLCSFIQTPDSGSAASQSNKDCTNLGRIKPNNRLIWVPS